MLIERSVRCDADGRFTIDRVPPGTVEVAILVGRDGKPASRASAQFWLARQRFELRPGEQRELTLGGAGRPVEGSIVVQAGVDVSGLSVVGWLRHDEPMPPLPRPDAITNGTADERSAWLEMFKRTSAYDGWRAKQREAMSKIAFLPLRWTSATTFRVDEVLPGDYRLEIEWRRRGLDRAVFVASSSPAMIETVAAWTEEPITLAPATVHRPAERAAVGSPAVDFRLARLDGQPVQLSDFRGKFVLLDLWATWCGPCIADLPRLREVHASFAGDSFTILSVSYDRTPDKPRAYVETQHLPWPQAWIGDPPVQQIGEAFAGGLPTYVLIDPAGNVAAIEMSGDELKTTVARAIDQWNHRAPSTTPTGR